eukprot:TRINITY_DN5190_c0_g1_i1.p1 TRINITY_DN5190_c0_g1~~TRINITY_DN5190_c0_g1_i1.p1  ORF type:complete len:714 (-),score=110.34 TRINITY_DN5190_c0_g1_i1:287-2428(-)
MRNAVVKPTDAKLSALRARGDQTTRRSKTSEDPDHSHGAGGSNGDSDTNSSCTESDDEPQNRGTTLASGYFKSEGRRNVDLTNLSCMERKRHYVQAAMRLSYFDALVGGVMMFDVIIMIHDVDARAGKGVIPMWMEVCSCACLAFYTIEFGLAVFANGTAVLQQKVIFLDVFVLLIGYLDVMLAVSGASDWSQIGVLKILRVLRMMRLLRMARNSPALKELRRLAMMLGGCLRILLWSSVFLFIVQTLWGIIAVECLQPIMSELIDEGLWPDCHLCHTAFSSVMRANLTLFKTIIAGDSWGLLAEPIIVRYPWCSLIFTGSFLSLAFGVMNLVVAVVVDTAAEQRQKDIMSVAQDLEDEQEGDLQFLTEIFKQIDEDASGELELHELIKGAEEVPEFQSRLRVMDIDKNDLVQLFSMLDADGGGSISPEEFKVALNRWLYDSKTATRFVKYNVQRLVEQQQTLLKTARNQNRKFGKELAKLTKLVKDNMGSPGSENTSPTLRPKQSTIGSPGPQEHSFRDEVLERNPENCTKPHSCAGVHPSLDACPANGSILQKTHRGDVRMISNSASPTLLEAAETAEHAVWACLQEAYQVLRKSALADAEASFQDAAAKNGVHVGPSIHQESGPTSVEFAMPIEKRSGRAGDDYARQIEAVAQSASSEVTLHSVLDQRLQFGPSIIPSVKPEVQLISDLVGQTECFVSHVIYDGTQHLRM